MPRKAGPAPTFECAHCGAVKERRKCLFKDGRWGGSYDRGQRFCSKECGLKGRNRRPVSGAAYVGDMGYKILRFQGGIKKYEHRLVMERMLGRSLRHGEQVHHKDGDRGNNNPSNLELWSVRQPPGQRAEDKMDWALQLLSDYPELAAQRGFLPTANGAYQVILGALSMAA